jgi:predicted ATPase
MLKRIRASGLLSFGPSGIDLELRPLNVLIGPNGSGKSNLLELLALLKAAPSNLPRPLREAGGAAAWFWRGATGAGTARFEAVVDTGKPVGLRHVLELTLDGEDRLRVEDEQIENEKPLGSKTTAFFLYRYQGGQPVLYEGRPGGRTLKRESLKADQSVLAQIRDPDLYPELSLLQNRYEGIRLYRNWYFGPGAEVRRAQPPDLQSDQLLETAENLGLVLQELLPTIRIPLLESLERLYDGVEDFYLGLVGGRALPFLVETGGRRIPASRLSDGTLRYLALLAVLLHPSPPPLVAIEEPELGLHPDLLHHVADLLIQASERTQLIVTTHSRGLIDALGEHPESVVVTSKEDGETRFERLDPDRMAVWLEKYSLGELWSSGELGGNRW